MEYVILAVLGLMILVMPVLLLVGFAFLAVVIFVWRKIFPLGWGIAEWITNRRNLIPFILFLLIIIAGSIILLILSYVFATQVHVLGYIFLLLFLFILFIAETIFWGGIGLAVILWIVRLSHWAYALFRRGFWRTFRPGGEPVFQPVPAPLTNPILAAPPRSKHTGNRKRHPLAKGRVISSTSLVPPPKEKAQPKDETMRQRPTGRRRVKSSTAFFPRHKEKAQAKEENKNVKEQAREAKRNQAVAEAEEKARAKEEVKKAKEQAREGKGGQAVAEAEEKARAKEEVKKAKEQAREGKGGQAEAEAEEEARIKEEAKKTITEEKSGEITNPGRRRRIKRYK